MQDSRCRVIDKDFCNLSNPLSVSFGTKVNHFALKKIAEVFERTQVRLNSSSLKKIEAFERTEVTGYDQMAAVVLAEVA